MLVEVVIGLVVIEKMHAWGGNKQYESWRRNELVRQNVWNNFKIQDLKEDKGTYHWMSSTIHPLLLYGPLQSSLFLPIQLTSIVSVFMN